MPSAAPANLDPARDMKSSAIALPRALLCCSLTLSAVAQQPAVTVTTASYVLTTATINGVTTTDFAPPGSTGAWDITYSTLLAGAEFCNAAASWSSAAGPMGAFAEFDAGCVITTPLPASAGTGPNEYRVELTSDVLVDVELHVTRETTATGGAAAPFASIDFDDDGTIEVADVPASGPPIRLQLGPQPRALRVILGANVTGVGTSHTRVTLRVVPANDLQVAPVALGCSPHALELLPVFEQRGLFFQLPFGVTSPTVAVLATSWQPVLLPSSAIGPCLLLPTPEVLVPMPSSSLQPLALPDAVRPFVLWAQVALLEPTGVELTDAFRIVGR